MHPRLYTFFLAAAFTALLPVRAQAATTPAQNCESAMELASAKYAQCRLSAESKDTKTPDPVKFAAALMKCSAKLSDAFAKATDKYGMSCAATEPSAAFDAYLKQCSDDATAAAGGAALPDYVGDLASCNADLTTAQDDLTTAQDDLTMAQGDLTTCQGDLATCQATPSARLRQTGQTTSYGAGSDGELQKGIASNYVDNGDGTITDTTTGLMWEKKSDDGTIHDKDNTYTWGTVSPPYTMNGTMVTTFLAALNASGGFAGHTDWRIPNEREYHSLVNLGAAPPTFTAFNTGCVASCTVETCSCTIVGYSWSSSTFQTSPQYAWAQGFASGIINILPKTDSYPVRAVRAGS